MDCTLTCLRYVKHEPKSVILSATKTWCRCFETHKLCAFNTSACSDYGGMSRYHGQSFFGSLMVEDGDLRDAGRSNCKWCECATGYWSCGGLLGRVDFRSPKHMWMRCCKVVGLQLARFLTRWLRYTWVMTQLGAPALGLKRAVQGRGSVASDLAVRGRGHVWRCRAIHRFPSWCGLGSLKIDLAEWKSS